jgi:putative endonuclease
MTHDRANLGAGGETFARRWLEARGYAFIAANWRCPAGELDLVARDGVELVFVEVKTRRGERAGRAEESVTPAKARRLLASGAAFVAANPEYADAIWRIDLLAITLGPTGAVARVSHLPNSVVTG